MCLYTTYNRFPRLLIAYITCCVPSSAVILCKKRWSNLRNTYARELRRERNVASNKMKVGSPWYFKENVGFLREHIRPSSKPDIPVKPQEMEVVFKCEVIKEESIDNNADDNSELLVDGADDVGEDSVREAHSYEQSYSDISYGTSTSDYALDGYNTSETIINDVMISSASVDQQVSETIRSFDGMMRWYWLSQNDSGWSDELDKISALYSLDDDEQYIHEPSGNRALSDALLAPLFLTPNGSDDQQPELTETAAGPQLPTEP